MIKRCPTCSKVFSEDLVVCPHDNSSLERAESTSPSVPSMAAATSTLVAPSGRIDTTDAVVPIRDEDLRAHPSVEIDATEAFVPIRDEDLLARQDEDDLAPGSMLGGLYKVVRRIGVGGMGTVYEIEHLRMQKRFAAKVLRRELSVGEHVKRLEREATTAGSLDHPNIMQVVNLDETAGGRVFLVCELLNGHDLARLVEEGPLDIAAAFQVAVAVTGALQRAHDAGIVHRDLKPDNVFLHSRGGDPVVKVLDFGVSKVEEHEDAARLTAAGTVLGTPAYMSPEAAEGRSDVDHRADIYSLGAMLYEMCTGTLPFSGLNTVAMMMAHVHGELTPPSERKEGLPPGLDTICLKAMAKGREERYQSMSEMGDALRALAEELALPQVVVPMLDFDADAGRRSLTPGPVAITTERPPESSGARWLALVAVVALVGAGAFFFLGDGGGANAPAARPAPPRPAPPVVPAPPKPPPAPTHVDITVETIPAGAQVFEGATQLGITPVTLSMARSEQERELTFKLRRHKPRSRVIVPKETRTVTVELEVVKKSKKKRRRKSKKAPKGLKIRGQR